MIYEAFSIFDSKGLMYSPPFYDVTKGLAIRRFSETATDRNTSIGLHPEDFTLFHVGSFDDSNAMMTAARTAEPLIKASETLQPAIAPQQKNGPVKPIFPTPPFETQPER